jgi:hypothetical protein
MVRNRVSIKDRVLQWGISVDPVCQFCRQFIEDRDHLFFKCSFTSRIWKYIIALCLVPNVPFEWTLILEWGGV